mmetsp:Transcript_8184/g.21032  ORF Transcript_8184/g.21032 Transcript_8184/m.21032 type:complete len:225 (+) Transcript_8184:1142-1816(+)
MPRSSSSSTLTLRSSAIIERRAATSLLLSQKSDAVEITWFADIVFCVRGSRISHTIGHDSVFLALCIHLARFIEPRILFVPSFSWCRSACRWCWMSRTRSSVAIECESECIMSSSYASSAKIMQAVKDSMGNISSLRRTAVLPAAWTMLTFWRVFTSKPSSSSLASRSSIGTLSVMRVTVDPGTASWSRCTSTSRMSRRQPKNRMFSISDFRSFSGGAVPGSAR